MRTRYNPLARDEVIKAANYFEDQGVGLGHKFLTAIDQAVNEIADSPLAWPRTKYGTRKRILVSPFPYTIHYKIQYNELVIIAVAHQSREPEFWKDRVD